MGFNLKGQSILLTGASGFIGQHVLGRLIELGADVTVAGRATSSIAVASSYRYLACDLGDGATFEPHHDALQQVQAVVHLGGFMLRGSDLGDDDPVLAMKLNVQGTVQLLQHLPRKLARFCHISTVDVYGPPQTLPVTEDHPTRPLTFYGASKLAAESLLKVWEQRTQIPVTVLRLSQVYGPGDTSSKAIPNFIRAILGGSAPVVIGNGSDVRDYVFVDDVVTAIVCALARCNSGILNIANGHGCTISEVVATLLRLSGNHRSPIFKSSGRPATHIVLNVDRAKAELGFEPRVKLEVGLRRTLDWSREHANGE